MRLRAALLLATVLALSGCGGGADTADAHDVDLPEGVESALPMPSEASIRAVQEVEPGTVSMVFSPGMRFGEAAGFFSDAFAADDDWTVISEDVDDGDGEVGAQWDVEGHGVEVTVSLTGFGGQTATNVSGVAIVES